MRNAISKIRTRGSRWACCAALLFGASHVAWPAVPQTVNVLTSFPPAFYRPFEKAFDRAEPGFRLAISNMKTPEAVAFLKSFPAEPVDVFWASSPDAFSSLASADRLSSVPGPRPGAPPRIGRYPINDPRSRYLGFALSGYGVVWNARALTELKLPVPRRWVDLTHPEWAGKLGMCSPSRSGTTHVMVEMLLQREGWRRGWARLMEMSGNLATITARSYGVNDGVRHRRFAIGLTIDFLGQDEHAKDPSVHFSYLADNIFLPASVAILKGGPDPVGARIFVDFLLSHAGQKLLLRLHRLPVKTSLYDHSRPNPYALAAYARSSFDPALSAARYQLVNLLFDELITAHQAELRRIWHDIDDAQAMPAYAQDAKARQWIEAARNAITAIPVTPDMASDPTVDADLRWSPPGVPVSARQAKLLQQWRRFSESHMAQAQALARQALDRLRALKSSP